MCPPVCCLVSHPSARPCACPLSPSSLTAFQPQNWMVSAHARSKDAAAAKYVTMMHLIQGEVDAGEVNALHHTALFYTLCSMSLSLKNTFM